MGILGISSTNRRATAFESEAPIKIPISNPTPWMGLGNSSLARTLGFEFFEDVFQQNLAEICKSQEAPTQIEPPSRGYLCELPVDLLRGIVDCLDPVSKKFLSQSCRGWRDLLQGQVLALNPCERWKAICMLERASMFRNRAIPDVLACAFCKKGHPREDFQSGFRDRNIASIGMENWRHPETRFCYRHTEKRIDFGFKRLSEDPPPAQKHASKQHWRIIFEQVCGHCGCKASASKSDADFPASWSCTQCKDICKTCGITRLFCIVGTGPRRTRYNGRLILITCGDLYPKPPQRRLMIRDGTVWHGLKAFGLDWSTCKEVELPWPDLDAWRKYS